MVTPKVLGQSFPTSTTLTDIYTVPALTSTMANTITVCNQSSTADTFRISIAIAGAGDSQEQYIYYGNEVPGNTSFQCTSGYTLGATDVIRVYSTNGTCSFNISGIEAKQTFITDEMLDY